MKIFYYSFWFKSDVELTEYSHEFWDDVIPKALCWTLAQHHSEPLLSRRQNNNKSGGKKSNKNFLAALI